MTELIYSFLGFEKGLAVLDHSFRSLEFRKEMENRRASKFLYTDPFWSRSPLSFGLCLFEDFFFSFSLFFFPLLFRLELYLSPLPISFLYYPYLVFCVKWSLSLPLCPWPSANLAVPILI